MDDGSQDDLRDRLYRELSEAYDGFFTELVQTTRIWGFWVGRRRIVGPYSSWGLARIYQVMLLVFFVAGVVLSVLSPGNQGLGSALVVGSLFAAGAWIAQLWGLSTAEWFRLRNELLGEVRLLLSPWHRTPADLARELSPNQRNASYYAAQVKDIVDRIKELDRTDRTGDSNP